MPVGLEPQRELEGTGRHRLEVVRAVEPRRGVEPGALVHEGREVLARRDVAAALEHQVLEEVGEAGASGGLVAGADADPQVHRDVGHRVVLADDDAQAVGERVLRERVGDRCHEPTLCDGVRKVTSRERAPGRRVRAECGGRTRHRRLLPSGARSPHDRPPRSRGQLVRARGPTGAVDGRPLGSRTADSRAADVGSAGSRSGHRRQAGSPVGAQALRRLPLRNPRLLPLPGPDRGRRHPRHQDRASASRRSGPTTSRRSTAGTRRRSGRSPSSRRTPPPTRRRHWPSVRSTTPRTPSRALPRTVGPARSSASPTGSRRRTSTSTTAPGVTVRPSDAQTSDN